MDRVRYLSAIALVLAVVAVGTVAGGLASDGGGEATEGLGIGSGEGSGVGQSEGVGLGGSAEFLDVFPTWLTFGPIVLFVWLSGAAFVVVTILFLWRSSLGDLLAQLKESARIVLAVGLAVALVFAILLLFEHVLGGGGGGTMGESVSLAESVLGESSTDATSPVSGVVLVAGAALAAVLLVVLLSHDRTTKADDGTAMAVPDDGESGTPNDGWQPGGDASEPAATNEVFRAWVTLRDRVGRPDRTESPAELRRRALDAGLDEAAVSELTDLFNAARYGDRPVTATEERRAREALSAIEDERGER